MTSGARSIVDSKICNGRRMIRRTKIICTVGPATASYEKLKAMKILDEKVDQEILLHDSDKKYFEEASRVNKEYLLLSLLKTVAFEYLCKEVMGI